MIQQAQTQTQTEVFLEKELDLNKLDNPTAKALIGAVAIDIHNWTISPEGKGDLQQIVEEVS